MKAEEVKRAAVYVINTSYAAYAYVMQHAGSCMHDFVILVLHNAHAPRDSRGWSVAVTRDDGG